MRPLMTAMLVAASLLPGVANAQSREELARDRQDIRREQAQLHDAYRRGDARDIRDERRDVRDARQEYREDRADRDRRWGRDDYRGWRERNRNLYARGQWRAPFAYRAFRPGVRIQPSYYGSGYWLADPWRYHLPRPGAYQHWVRHYDDVLLVDTRRGVVVDVIRSFYR